MKNINEKGLTLLEVLATIIILAIVLVSFLNFFTQSLSHSRITENKLTAINLAESMLVQIKEIENLDNNEGKEVLKVINTNPIEVNEKLYYVTANTSESLTIEESKLGLRKISVSIYKDSKDISDRVSLTVLYGYR